MKRYLIVFCILMMGCVSMTVPVEDLTYQKRTQLVNFDTIQKGMTQEEVLNIIKKNSFLGYEVKEGSSGAFSPLEIEGAYRTETLEKANQTYVILYYLSSIIDADGIVSDDELMPLIFKDNKLVDKGWNELFKLKNKN